MKKLSVVILAAVVVLLTGCAGVEPEHRSYPLIMSADYIDGEYQIIYGMANLPQQTGQLKSAEEISLVRAFTGANMQEVLEDYNSSQQYHLDLGHVQVLVLGQNLLEQEKQLKDILQYMEEEPMIGDKVYLFSSENPRELLSVNGIMVDSLGEYLIGIYKNRLKSDEDQALTLQQLCRVWHNEHIMLTPPLITLEDGIPKIEGLAD